MEFSENFLIFVGNLASATSDYLPMRSGILPLAYDALNF